MPESAGSQSVQLKEFVLDPELLSFDGLDEIFVGMRSPVFDFKFGFERPVL
jgi:hypothetical protein